MGPSFSPAPPCIRWPPAVLCDLNVVGVTLKQLGQLVSDGPRAFRDRNAATAPRASSQGVGIPAAEVDAVHSACYAATSKLVKDLHDRDKVSVHAGGSV